MNFDLAPKDDRRRLSIRSWLQDHPSASPRQLAEAGLLAPQWPAPWGMDADALHASIIGEELEAAGYKLRASQIGLGWVGPTLLFGGSSAQKDRYLFPLLAREELWCQLFSEPDSGSDLASVSTRAVRDGNSYVINGHKIWSSWADTSDFGILLARTREDVAKRNGLSYFVCPMDSPGLTISPIKEMTGGHHFNEVFFDNVRIPAADLVGEENDGWRLTKVTLANERMQISNGGGVLWGRGPSSQEIFETIAAQGGIDDPVLRQRMALAYTDARLLELLERRSLITTGSGNPGAEVSLKKLLSDEHGQRIMELVKDLSGAGGMLNDSGPLGAEGRRWNWAYLFARALTIGGGTAQVQRNILAEQVLGLPREPEARS